MNKGQLVGTHDGRVIVPAHEWSSFLGEYFNKLPNIKKYQHFRFSKDEPGRIYFKETRSSPEQSHMLLKNRVVLPPATMLPPKLNPEGLSEERKQYLYREIRQFVQERILSLPFNLGMLQTNRLSLQLNDVTFFPNQI